MAVAVPKHVVTNDELLWGSFAREAERITGIHERRWAQGQESDLAELAVKAAEALHVDLSNVESLIVATQTYDHRLPGLSSELHRRLDLRSTCITLDLSAACAGYVQGLLTAEALIAAGRARSVLLIAGDTLSKYVDLMDRATAPLFGDAVSATLIQRTEKMPVASWVFRLSADGNGQSSLFCSSNGRLQMDGNAVFTFALKEVPPLIKSVLDDRTFDFAILHQANKLIVESIARRAGIEMTKVPMSLRLFGNTSSASIPLTMVTQIADRLRKERLRLLMCGFGAGYAAAAALMYIGPFEVCNLAEV